MEQGELARRVGVTQQTVSKWETGLTIPRPARIAALAEALALEAGMLHAAAADGPSAAEGVAVGLLSEDDLEHLIDAARRELRRRRRGQAGTDSQDSRR